MIILARQVPRDLIHSAVTSLLSINRGASSDATNTVSVNLTLHLKRRLQLDVN